MIFLSHPQWRSQSTTKLVRPPFVVFPPTEKGGQTLPLILCKCPWLMVAGQWCPIDCTRSMCLSVALVWFFTDPINWQACSDECCTLENDVDHTPADLRNKTNVWAQALLIQMPKEGTELEVFAVCVRAGAGESIETIPYHWKLYYHTMHMPMALAWCSITN